MATEQDQNNDKEPNELKFAKLLEEVGERMKVQRSDAITRLRNITSEVRGRLDLTKKQGNALKNNNEFRNEINAILRKTNSLASSAYNLTEDENLLLLSEEDITKRILQNDQNRLSIQRERTDLLTKAAQLRKEGNEEGTESKIDTARNLRTIEESLESIAQGVEDYSLTLTTSLEKVRGLSQSYVVTLFEELSKNLTKIPILSKALQKGSEASRERRRGLNLKDDILDDRFGAGFSSSIKGIRGQKGFGKGLDAKFFEQNPELAKLTKGKKGDQLFGQAAAENIQSSISKSGLDKVSSFSKFSKTLVAGGKAFATSIKSSLGPILIIKEVFEALILADKEVVELQKSFALTVGEAMLLRTEIAGAAADSGNINITTTKLLENLTALSKEFGFVAQFSSDTLVTMTKLTTQVGLTAQEAAQLAAAAEITDTSFEDIYKNVLGASYELQQQAGVQFDLREILKATNSVTGQVRANLGANPEAIAKAVTQAKLFGAELDTVVNSSKQLLQFEESIRNELQAELLIGRDLNLERARSAALLGDQETVAKELAAQAQDFTSFTKLNVLQQDALSASLGMQSDQLSDILFKQEVQNKTAKELRALGKDELANRLEQQTLADKFSATIEKLKGIFTDVATAFMPVLKGFGAALSLVGALVGLVGDLFNLFRGDFDFSGFTSGLKGAAGALGFDGSFDDAIIPPDGQVLSGPEGTFKLNPKDTVVAGTDLFGQTSLSQMPDYQQVMGQTNMVSPTINQGGSAAPIQTGATTINNQTVNQDFEQFVNRIEKVETAINNQTKVLAKGQENIAKTKTKLTVGATDFGTELNVNSFRIQ